MRYNQIVPVDRRGIGGVTPPLVRAKLRLGPATYTSPLRGQTGQALDRMALDREAAVKR